MAEITTNKHVKLGPPIGTGWAEAGAGLAGAELSNMCCVPCTDG